MLFCLAIDAPAIAEICLCPRRNGQAEMSITAILDHHSASCCLLSFRTLSTRSCPGSIRRWLRSIGTLAFCCRHFPPLSRLDTLAVFAFTRFFSCFRHNSPSPLQSSPRREDDLRIASLGISRSPPALAKADLDFPVKHWLWKTSPLLKPLTFSSPSSPPVSALRPHCLHWLFLPCPHLGPSRTRR